METKVSLSAKNPEDLTRLKQAFVAALPGAEIDEARALAPYKRPSTLAPWEGRSENALVPVSPEEAQSNPSALYRANAVLDGGSEGLSQRLQSLVDVFERTNPGSFAHGNSIYLSRPISQPMFIVIEGGGNPAALAEEEDQGPAAALG